jgi:hypothetical protein
MPKNGFPWEALFLVQAMRIFVQIDIHAETFAYQLYPSPAAYTVLIAHISRI